MNKIDSFDGNYSFLSNFYNCVLMYDGLVYTSAEAAFQAAKTLTEIERLEFTQLPPNKAKRLGRRAKLRPDWEQVKDQVMYDVVRAKFEQNSVLRLPLLATGTAELVEGNWWKDTYWGVCNGVGQNKLGKILMRVREELRVIEQGTEV